MNPAGRRWFLAISLTLLSGCGAWAAADGSIATPGAMAVEVAPGVYFMQGASGEVGASNLGRIGNAGFIVGPRGVLAIDTGTSYGQGTALLEAIHRVTDQPVRLVVVTHARQEFLFGAAAFQQAGIPVRMQRQAADLMRSRCDRCLATLKEILGDAAMQRTRMFEPDETFETSHEIDAIGRPVKVLYFGHSSGPGAVAVLDEISGVLFAGGLIDNQRIPDVQDGDLDGWIRALRELRKLRITAVVPGHGPVASPAVIDSVERYLSRLQSRVLELLKAGAALSDVPDAAALDGFVGWDQYDTIHRRNASILFIRFERDLLFGPEPPKH